jgi:N-acyl-D-aspartate/D-glutamate deacylase
MGNCGVGFAPVRSDAHERLIELMEGVEDIPGAVLHEGIDWAWESFPQYLDVLDKLPHDMDIAAQLPHGALRLYVMGERGARLEAATPADIAQMRALTADAMRAGAIGFSSSRTAIHRTAKGTPTPSLRAAEDELLGIAHGLADAGSGVIELISDFDTPNLDDEFAMIRRVAEAAGRPTSLSLLQLPRTPDSWRQILTRVQQAANDGLPMRCQAAPRPIGLMFSLQGTLHPFCQRPSFIAIQDKPLSEKLAALRTPAFRARLLAEEAVLPAIPFKVNNYANIFALGDPPNYEPAPDQCIAAIAKREGRAPDEVAYDLLIANDGGNILFSPFANFVDGNLDACGEMIGHRDCLMGLGDGGAHVGFISDASFPTYLLTHWGRDRKYGRFDVAWLVKRYTSDNAHAVGLKDRGIIAPGMKADLNVIDFDRLALAQPTMAFDLPAGGRRLLQRARGYAATIVSGKTTYREGVATEALPGRLIRAKR